MTLQDLEQMDYDELLEVCDTDPAHVAYAEPEPEDWLCGTQMFTDFPEWNESEAWLDEQQTHKNNYPM